MPNYDESGEFGETLRGGSPSSTPATYLTLPKAIEFGQYHPQYLAQWKALDADRERLYVEYSTT